MRTYVLRFLKAGKAVYQREFYATDARVACLIARAACRASEVAHDTTELWEGTRQIEWVPPTNALSLAEDRQGNIIDREIALTNSAWALNAARTLLSKKEGEPKKRES